jgi:hypothetical protein
MTRNSKRVFKQLHYILTAPTKCPVVLLKLFPSDWYVIPLLLLGAKMSTRALFCRFDDEIYPQIQGYACPIGNTGASACPMAACSGF